LPPAPFLAPRSHWLKLTINEPDEKNYSESDVADERQIVLVQFEHEIDQHRQVGKQYKSSIGHQVRGDVVTDWTVPHVHRAYIAELNAIIVYGT